MGSSSRRPGLVALLPAAAALCLLATSPAAVEPHFYPDDPLWTDDDMALDASATAEIEDSNGYDFIVHTFVRPGDRRDVRAMNVNTVDEVPDSSWFVNRIGRRPMAVDEIVRGPDARTLPSLEGWVVSGGKSTGVQAGFRMKDPSGHTYQIEFDPPDHPEMATGAEVIGTAFYHAFGYHTVEVYLADLDPASLVIAPDATINDPLIGRRRRLTRRDVDDVLRRSARRPDGRYRVLASRFAEGQPRGNFRYYGTRPDDPNDLVPHEHRRELRAARVFGAWLNHDDSRGVNSLDFLTTEGDRRYIKHYMFDFGSIMGSGTKFAQRHRAGNEYILEWKPGWLTLATLGLYTRPWLHIDYPRVPPAVGRFEGTAFDPVTWKPEYPNPAFDNMRADDAFWAARIVAQFDEDAIRAVVAKGGYTDPQARAYIGDVLIERRRKVLRTWLAGVNPLVDFSFDGAALRFRNAAADAGAAPPAMAVMAVWSRFDNATATATEIGRTAGEDMQATGALTLPAPTGLRSAAPEFVQVEVSATHAEHPSWAVPVVVHFRRSGDGWQLAGVRRIPD